MDIRRLLRFEFWPFGSFISLPILAGLDLASKARYTTYFTAANPLMNNSGAPKCI